MSKVLFFDLDGRSIGEVSAVVDRGWSLGQGGQVSIQIGEKAELAQFGRMVMIPHEKLPAWVGMIDTPWEARRPVTVTAYSAEYLLRIRALTTPAVITGSAGAIVAELIRQANTLQDLRLRPGAIDLNGPERQEVFDTTQIFAQLQKLVTKAGMEMQTRAERDEAGRLWVALDMQRQIGQEVNYLLRDGRKGNVTLTEASISGEFSNYLVGVGDQSTQASRLVSEPEIDAESAALYRLRSRVAQFSGVDSEGVLQADTAAELARNSRPTLAMTLRANDIGDVFHFLRPGNILPARFSDLVLPGGRVGWSGMVRILPMEYSEKSNQVEMKVTGAL